MDADGGDAAMTAPTTLRRLAKVAEAQIGGNTHLAALEQVAARYAVAITPVLADLIDAADPHDPIARQFVHDARELDFDETENGDPIGDAAHSPVEGVVHRYP